MAITVEQSQFDALWAVIEQQKEDAALLASDMNTAWLLLCGFLVFFMQCGFIMLSIGAVRSKNVKNMILYVMMDATVGALGWYLLGYGFAFGDPQESGNGFIGRRYFAMRRLPYFKGSSVPATASVSVNGFAHWFFEYTFAATASTIVSGSVVERAKISAYIGYSFFLTAFVYPVVAHWEWSATGWLSPTRVGGSILFGSGLLDFAGCGAVHMVGGISGIVGAALLGPRVGRFGYDGQARAMPGHNVPFAALGTFVLWFGWYGFNCGSTGSIINASAIASRVAVSTTLGGAAGGIAALSWAVTMDNVWDVTMALNGILAGLVSITSGCAFFEPWAAIIAGGVGGILFPIFSRILTRFKIDDPLEAGAMHGGCGAWGLLATGLLAQTKAVNAAYAVGAPDNGLPLRPGGGFYGHGQALAAQIVGIVTIGAWTAVNMFACFWLLRRFNLLRVPVDFEAMGMDESFHGGTAYPGEDTTVPLAYEAAPAGKQVELTNEPAAASGQL